MGQIEAVALGISRALEKMNAEWRGVLKKASLLTCDGRIKERKKPGRPGARKRFQFSKR
jgi:small subunit ribosomal protein S9